MTTKLAFNQIDSNIAFSDKIGAVSGSAQQIVTLHRNNEKITAITIRAKSSKASSTARARLSYLGLEG